MIYTLELEAEQVKVSYGENDYLLKREAIKLATLLEREQTLRKACAKRRIVLAFNRNYSPGSFRIVSDGAVICLSAADYLGLDGAVEEYCRKTKQGNVWKGGDDYCGHYSDLLNDFGTSSAYAYRHCGNARLMSYNVLWGHPNVCERNILQANVVQAYRPDILGLQECADNNRIYAGDQNIITLLEKLGYRESTDSKVAGTYRRRNVSPILYNIATTELIDSKVVIFRNQQENGETRLLTWAKLKEKKTGCRYIVLNTQLEGGNAVVGLGQVQEIEELINTLHCDEPDVPVFLMGDFNFIKTSNSYKYLTETVGCVYAKDLATVYAAQTKSYHPYPKFRTELGLMQPDGGAETDTDAIQSFDRIFLAKGHAEVSVFGVAVDECTLSASDHFPLFADVTISNCNL